MASVDEKPAVTQQAGVRTLTFIAAITQALDEELGRDERVRARPLDRGRPRHDHPPAAQLLQHEGGQRVV